MAHKPKVTNLDKIMTTDSLTSQTMPRYKIGELARTYGIHPQTLRYFDMEGLIQPSRNSETGERYYSNFDMYRITLRMQYRNLGCSVQDTNRIFQGCNLDGMHDVLEQCEIRISEERRLMEIKERGLRRLRERLAKISTHQGHCFFEKRPAMWQHIHMINGTLAKSDDARDARQMLLNSMPLCFYSFSFEPTQLGEDPNSYLWNIAAEEKDAILLGFDQIPTAQYVPEEYCVYTIFSIKGDAPVNRQSLDVAMDFLKRNYLEVNGTIYGTAIIEMSGANSESVRYFEAWIPVCDSRGNDSLQ